MLSKQTVAVTRRNCCLCKVDSVDEAKEIDNSSELRFLLPWKLKISFLLRDGTNEKFERIVRNESYVT